MRSWRMLEPGQELVLAQMPVPEPGPGQLLVRVEACAVCRTDLHLIAGELPNPRLPVTPGHEVVGVVEACGAGTTRLAAGARVGVPWLGYTCGVCQYCSSGRENLCPRARFTGYTLDGGYADYLVADERYCFEPEGSASTDVGKGKRSSVQLAPLLCAGMIGYRSLKMAGAGERVGLYGFGAAAHLALQVLRYQGRRSYVFVRPGDEQGRRFAESLGADWVGDSTSPPPQQLDCAILYAPIGELVPLALRAVSPGGRVICAGIHMSDIPAFPYDILWGERSIHSVANLTRRDGEEFLELARRIPIQTTVQQYALEDAPRALEDLRQGRLVGAAVLST